MRGRPSHANDAPPKRGSGGANLSAQEMQSVTKRPKQGDKPGGSGARE